MWSQQHHYEFKCYGFQKDKPIMINLRDDNLAHTKSSESNIIL
jgi:hypothetical protein